MCSALPLKNPVTIGALNSPRDWLVMADLNSDGRPDVMCAGPGSSLRWWRNDGGAFTQQTDIPINDGAPVAVVACNFDRDRDTDLVVLVDPGNAPGKIHLVENQGAAGFNKTGEIALTGKLVPGCTPLVEDFDRDGDLDVMIGHQDAAQSPGNDVLALSLNNGFGTFAAPVAVTSALNWPTALAWHDCDKNGLPDLIVGTTGTPGLRVYGDYKPGGGLLVADLVSNPPLGIAEIRGKFPGAIFVRYNGPGGGADNGIKLRQSLEGLLDWDANAASAAASTVTSMEVATVGEDGPYDLYFLRHDAATGERSLWVLRADRFSIAAKLGVPGSPRAIRCADVDNDGDDDVVLLRDGDVALMRDDSIRPRTSLIATEHTLNLPHPAVNALAVADLFPDPGPEIAGAVTDEGSIRVFEISQSHDPQPGVVVTNAAPGVSALEAADLDRDGDNDLVFNSPGDDRVKWIRNNGDGTFSAPSSIIAMANPGPLDVADIDRDGDNDVVMTFADGSVVIAMNSGAANPSWTFEDGGTVGGIVALDVHVADTSPGLRQEILVQTFSFGSPASSLKILRHLIFPQPGWFVETLATGGASSNGIAVTDIDRDGDLDVIAGPGARPSIFVNIGNGTFNPPVIAADAGLNSLRRLAAFDLERDGVTEVIGVTADAVKASPVGTAGFGQAVNVAADFTGLSLRDVAVLSLFDPADYLVVSDGTTPALRLIHNDRRQIDHVAEPVGTGSDPRGGRSAVYRLTASSLAPAGGPLSVIQQLAFNVRKGAADLSVEAFQDMVQAIELWLDGGVIGQLDSPDELIYSEDNASLNGAGSLNVLHGNFNDARLTLAPQQTRQYLVALRFKPDPVPGLDGFTMRWIGPNLPLRSYMTGDVGAIELLTATGTTTERIIELASQLPLEQWRVSHWGAPEGVGPAANDADPDGDGLPNLIEYALGTSPLAGNASPVDGLFPFIDSLGRFTVASNFCHPPRTDITITLQRSTTLKTGEWTTFATRIGDGAWTGPAITSAGGIFAGRQLFSFTESTPAGTQPGFIRLHVSAP